METDTEGPTTNIQAPASNLYYVVGPGRVHAFERIGIAEEFRRTLSPEEQATTQLISHSKRAMRKLSMDLLMEIVRTGRPDISATSLKRDELVNAAYSSLWAASTKPEGFETMASNETTTPTKNVRSMRSERKTNGGTKTRTRPRSAAKAVKGTRTAPVTSSRPRVTADPYLGKKLYLLSEDKKNPRREGTHGWKSMEIIRQSPGILYETYVEKGGRRIDLKGSLELKQAELK